MRPNHILLRHPPPWRIQRGMQFTGRVSDAVVDCNGDVVCWEHPVWDSYELIWMFWLGMKDRPDVQDAYGLNDHWLAPADFEARGFAPIVSPEGVIGGFELHGAEELTLFAQRIEAGDEITRDELSRPVIQIIRQPRSSDDYATIWRAFVGAARVNLRSVRDLDAFLRQEDADLDRVTVVTTQTRGFDL